MEIRTLSQHIERHIGALLQDIEEQKKVILAKAKQDALVDLHNAKKLSQEMINSTIRQTQKHLSELKEQAEVLHLAPIFSDNQKFILERSIRNLEMCLKEVNRISLKK